MPRWIALGCLTLGLVIALLAITGCEPAEVWAGSSYVPPHPLGVMPPAWPAVVYVPYNPYGPH
jgi:hypothetical protein